MSSRQQQQQGPPAADDKPGDANDGSGGRSFPWLTAAGFMFLTFNSGMAIYRSQGDPGAIAFVAFAYLVVVLLFHCLRQYGRAEPAGSPLRDRLAREERDGHGPPLVTVIGLAFLTFNSAIAVYSSSRDMGAISFLVFSGLDLLMLFYCLLLYKGAAPGSPRREHLKMAAWLLTTMLNFALLTLLEFWFSTTGDTTVKTGTAPHRHHQHPSSIP